MSRCRKRQDPFAEAKDCTACTSSNRRTIDLADDRTLKVRDVRQAGATNFDAFPLASPFGSILIGIRATISPPFVFGSFVNY